MGLCWSCCGFAKKNRREGPKPSSSVSPRGTDTTKKIGDGTTTSIEDDTHPAVLIEMATFLKGSQTTKTKKKQKSTKILRTRSLQSTVIRENDSSFHSGAAVALTHPRRRPSEGSIGQLSSIKLKTQRNVNPNSIRIRNNNENRADSMKTASDTALANFQKLKLQVDVAKKHKLRQQKAQELEEDVKETSKYNSLWTQLQEIQKKTTGPTPTSPPVEYDLKDANVAKPKSVKKKSPRFVASSGASVRSFLSQRSRQSRNSNKTDGGLRSSKSQRRKQQKKKKKSKSGTSTRKQSESFDLQDTDTWYFDFDGFSPASAKSKDGSTCGRSQANLSLLSESSLAVQRRLYEEKRRQRKQRQKRQQEIASLSASKCQSETSSQREDYGPTRMRRRPSQESLDFSFTDMEVVANPNNNNSYLSDLDNDSLSHLSFSSQDFPPNEDVVYDHDAVVKQRLDIEAQLRALQASDDEGDGDIALSTDGDLNTLLALGDGKDNSNVENLELRENVEAYDTPGEASGSIRPLQRFIPEVVASPRGSPCRAFDAPSPIRKLPDSPVRPSSEAGVVLSDFALQSSLSCEATKASITKLSPPNSSTRSMDLKIISKENYADSPPPSSPRRDTSKPANSVVIGKEASSPSSKYSPDVVLSTDTTKYVNSSKLTSNVNADDQTGKEHEARGSPLSKANDAQMSEAKGVSDKEKGSQHEPILDLEGSKARLNKNISIPIADESDPKVSKISPLKVSLCGQQGIDVSPSRERSSRRAQDSRSPLDESIASEESQLFHVPYNHQTPTVPFVVSSGNSQSDSLVVNQSIDDSVDDAAKSRTLSQPRVLLSSLQSPTSVLDARETLEIAGKVEAHVNDVLNRYRSEELYQS